MIKMRKVKISGQWLVRPPSFFWMVYNHLCTTAYYKPTIHALMRDANIELYASGGHPFDVVGSIRLMWREASAWCGGWTSVWCGGCSRLMWWVGIRLMWWVDIRRLVMVAYQRSWSMTSSSRSSSFLPELEEKSSNNKHTIKKKAKSLSFFYYW